MRGNKPLVKNNRFGLSFESVPRQEILAPFCLLRKEERREKQYPELMEETKALVRAILNGEQEIPYYPEAEVWLTFILFQSESPITREELTKKAESLKMPPPTTEEINWAFKRLGGRGWLREAYVIDSAIDAGWDGEWTYTLSFGAKKKLHEIMGKTPNLREAHKRLTNWMAKHPPDSPSEEVVLAYTLYLNESPLSIASIISEMDAVNKAGPNEYWLGAALLRLRKRGWLVIESGDTYGLTSEARQLMDTIVKVKGYGGGPDESLHDWMFANPPPGYELPDKQYYEDIW